MNSHRIIQKVEFEDNLTNKWRIADPFPPLIYDFQAKPRKSKSNPMANTYDNELKRVTSNILV